MPVVSIRHLTTYRYRKPVAFGEHRMMFRPLEAFDQQLLAAELTISPQPDLLHHLHDVSGACIGVARFGARADELVFDSRIRVDHTPANPLELDAPPALIRGERFEYAPEAAAELGVLRDLRGGADPAVALWARRFVSRTGPTPVGQLLEAMTRAIRGDFRYTLRLEGPPQDAQTTLSSRRGSCRDFATLMVEAARSLGLAARFVSGYLYSGSAKAGRTGGGHTHAWVRVYLPSCGWVDFDPTNGITGNADLIRVAVVSDPRLALPLHGTWDGAANDFLSMDVELAVEVGPQTPMQRPSHLRVAHAR